DADLVDEDGSRLTERRERLGLAPAAVQREHPLRVQALAQRLLLDECVQLADQLAVAPGREVLLDRQFQRGQAQRLQPADLGSGERLAGELLERRPTPQR